MLKCKLCKFETISQASFSKHTGFIHKLKFPKYLIQVKYNGKQPVCGCGCGKETRYEATKADFCKWIHGHQARIKGHFGEGLSKEQYQNVSKVRKAKFVSGEYEHVLKAIKENRKQPGLGDKISKGAKGVAKPKPKGFGIGRIHTQTTKNKMSLNKMLQWETGKIGKRLYKPSKLENTFANILDLLDITYQRAFYAKDIKAFYDFYIPKHNLIIEVDGDFWHSNPIKYPNGPISKCQIQNADRDKEKNKWAKENGYRLIRFWENDVNNNIKQVKKTLLENLANPLS